MAGLDDTSEMHGGPLDEQERRVVARLHALRADRAPDRLRADIERLRGAPRPQPRRWRSPAFGLTTATAAAAVLAAVVVLAGGSAAPTVLQAAALGLRGPVIGAPGPERDAPGMRIDRNVQGVYFPNWARFDWKATGQRVDRLDGRLAVTVYYAWHGHSIAYTILDSPPLQQPSATVTNFAGTAFRTLHLKSRMIVTWRRSGHTCILSGTQLPASALYSLASWHPAGGSL
jgi:hypothetical protein